MEKNESKTNAKTKLLNAALTVIRSKGYSSTTVDELCKEAGVTKGAFFHHFKSKEDLAVSAAQYWSTITNELFAQAPYHQHKDPLDRVLGYIEFRKDLLRGTTPEFTCLVGTMVQEAYGTHPSIREACHQSIFGHAEKLEADIQLAKKIHAPLASWTAKSVALHTQAVIQGAFILAKADQNAEIAAESIIHLKNYIQFLFNQNHKEKA